MPLGLNGLDVGLQVAYWSFHPFILRVDARQSSEEGAQRLNLRELRLEQSVLRWIRYLRQFAQIRIGKGSIPGVAAHMEPLLQMLTKGDWAAIVFPELESARVRLRSLAIFADKEPALNKVFVNFEDMMGEGVHVILTAADPSLRQCQENLRDDLNRPAHRKIRPNVSY